MMDDLISRKAMREAMYHEAMEKDSNEQKWDGSCWIRYKMFERVIESLPSAEPVIRCKDCKHYHTFEDGISVHISWCDLGHSREIDIYDEWFCGDAKPKEGEEE